MILYYAHSVRKYGTPQETKELKSIRRQFGNAEIINPRSVGSKVMKDYLDIVDTVDIVVFSEYYGYIGKGVYEEVMFALNRNIPLFLLRWGKFYKNFDVVRYGDNWAVYYAKVELKNGKTL